MNNIEVIENTKYRSCVGMMVVNEQNKVFIAKRIDSPNSWQMPQGGVEEGENLELAVKRELYEEIGTDKVIIIGKSKVMHSYIFPDEILEKMRNTQTNLYIGQKIKWFLLRFTGKDIDFNLNLHGSPEFLEWKCGDIDKLGDMIVDFKKEMYIEVVEEFKQLLSIVN